MSTRHTCHTVSLLRRPIKNGRLSLYLDFYPAIRNPETMKMTRREYLGIYIYAKPCNETQQDFNCQMLEKAEAIRCLRVASLINEKFDFLDRDRMNGDFLAYFKKMCRRKSTKWPAAYSHFSKFVRYHCTFGQLTVDLCRNFRNYLLSAVQLRRTHYAIRRNSAAVYYSTFRSVLKMAYRDKLLKENINEFLEKIDPEEVRKQYLTSSELKRLASTPCEIDVLKRASLFSCLTGLRISDILNLRWEDIHFSPDQGCCIRIRTQKTRSIAILPLSDEAVELCGSNTSSGIVFKGLKRSMSNHPLKKWIRQAGITKHITFHSFRHTYATLQIAAGTDIYTVSKMLTHKNVVTTQIYVHLVNEKKWATVSRITLK